MTAGTDQGGTPVLLAGSLGTDLSMWEAVAAALAQDRRIVTVDLPGHGGSGGVSPSPHLSHLSTALLEVLASAGGTPGHVVGCSLGAMAAIQLAADHPGAVSTLTLICTSAHLGSSGDWHARAAQVRGAGVGAIWSAVVNRWLSEDAQRHQPELVARCRAMLLATDAEAYATYCELLGGLDLRGYLPTIRQPTLVLSGAMDTATPPEHGRRLARTIPGARFGLVPAGHLAPMEAPAIVAGRISRHVNEAEAAGVGKAR